MCTSYIEDGDLMYCVVFVFTFESRCIEAVNYHKNSNLKKHNHSNIGCSKISEPLHSSRVDCVRVCRRTSEIQIASQ